jgi:excisionase family DNA binding protein
VELRSIPALAKFDYFAGVIMEPIDKGARRLTTKEAAIEAGVHPNTIRNLIKTGKLKAERIGSRIIRIQEQDLNALFTDYKGGEFGVWK